MKGLDERRKSPERLGLSKSKGSREVLRKSLDRMDLFSIQSSGSLEDLEVLRKSLDGLIGKTKSPSDSTSSSSRTGSSMMSSLFLSRMAPLELGPSMTGLAKLKCKQTQFEFSK